MSDVRKIAALAMLSPDEAETQRLQADMKSILEMGKTMPPPTGAQSVTHTVTADALRGDEVRPCADTVGLISLSQKARDGYIVVSRTVGGES